MSAVMIRCPATGRAIATGIDADPVSFRTAAVFFSRTYCPYCKTKHEWFAKDAWVCEPADAEVRAIA
jgi:hypothetical protein